MTNDDDLFDDDLTGPDDTDDTDETQDTDGHGPETGEAGQTLGSGARTGAVGDMSPRDFARLGLNHIAYVRAVREPVDDSTPSPADDRPSEIAAESQTPGDAADDDADSVPTVRWAIHAANGKRIGMAASPELAFAATRQHDMEPLSVH